MSLFSTILSKLGVGSAKAAPPPQRPPQPSASAGAGSGGAATAPLGGSAAPAAPSAPPPTAAPVDVAAVLEQRAAANPQKLNWRTSIVDLLKLLDMDSSLTARKELATELGCPAELMGDSAKMNVWLHKTVLARVAANGGRVPQELLN
jgi:hypothetical protein